MKSDSLKVLTSSDFNGWLTPEWFLELVRKVNRIGLDPATSAGNPTKADRFFTESGNGLLHPWEGDHLCFCNPPYGRHLFGELNPTKLITAKDKSGVPRLKGFGTGWAKKMAQLKTEGLYLTPARPETEWWRTLMNWCDWKLFWSSKEFGSRIKFVHPDPTRKTPGSAFPSSVFYKGDNVDRFLETFGPHGTLVPGTRLIREAFLD